MQRKLEPSCIVGGNENNIGTMENNDTSSNN
jgi:hypothetical protein